MTLGGRYEIIGKIGEGGMGAVYEARHTVIGKRVAVKVLLEKFLEKTHLVARLLQEARMASSIGHENIVDVTDFGTTADGRSFVVMEFLEGEALAALVTRDAPLPIERSLRIVRQVASALGAAHAKGIVHRDIKPENVFLIRRGELDFVKVVDFGVSKAVRTREENPEWQRLTHTGMVLGTPVYMSPEQAQGGDDVDHRADVWAVGVLLYECLTGEVPFRANNYLGVISQVINQDITPPSKLRPELGIPEAVETVVMRALQKDRDQRYQHMADVESDVERLLAGDQNLGLPPRSHSAGSAIVPRVRPRWPLAVLAVAVVCVGVGIALGGSGGLSAERHPSPVTHSPGSTSLPRALTAPTPASAPAPTPQAGSKPLNVADAETGGPRARAESRAESKTRRQHPGSAPQPPPAAKKTLNLLGGEVGPPSDYKKP